MSDYADYIAGPTWDALRRERLEVADYQCERCGIGDEPLDVHHLRYPTVLGTESVDDLQALCGMCHIEADLERQEETADEREANEDELWQRRLSGYMAKRWPLGLPDTVTPAAAKRAFAQWLDLIGEAYPAAWEYRLMGRGKLPAARTFEAAPLPFTFDPLRPGDSSELLAALSLCPRKCVVVRGDHLPTTPQLHWTRATGHFVRDYIRYVASGTEGCSPTHLAERLRPQLAAGMMKGLVGKGVLGTDFVESEIYDRIETGLKNLGRFLSTLPEEWRLQTTPLCCETQVDGQTLNARIDLLFCSAEAVNAICVTTRTSRTRTFSNEASDLTRQKNLALTVLRRLYPEEARVHFTLVGLLGDKAVELEKGAYQERIMRGQTFNHVRALREVESILSDKAVARPNPLCKYCPGHAWCEKEGVL